MGGVQSQDYYSWKVSCISLFEEISSFNPLTCVRDQEKINVDLFNGHIASYYWILVITHHLDALEYSKFI